MTILTRLLIFFLPVTVLAQANPPARINLAGTFNDWSPTNAAWQMTLVTNDVYAVKKFFKAGDYQFKFAYDGGWDKHWGADPDGKLVQPGNDIPLHIAKHGAYVVELDTARHRWSLRADRVAEPHAVLLVRGEVGVNIPIVLDGSESVARPAEKIVSYQLWQNTNAAPVVILKQAGDDGSRVTVRLPREGTYRFCLRVNDGMVSEPDCIMLKAETGYQILGDWTADDPSDPATFMKRESPGAFERLLESKATGERRLILVRNHNSDDVVGKVTVNVAQTGRQFWRVRYDEKAKRFTCEPEKRVEFAYRPKDDPALKGRGEVRTVNLAGTFNGWNSTVTPMIDRGDGTYVVHLKLDEGLHHYKFVVNGNTWMQDPNADPELRADDGHSGFNSGVYVGQRGEDFGAAPTNDVNLAAVQHLPDSPRFFNAASSDLVVINLRTLRDDAKQVVVRAGDRSIPMQKSESALGFDYWTANTDASIGQTTLTYYFELTDGPTTRSFGAGQDKQSKSGVKPFVASLVPQFVTPEWARHVVWYQIFPERFRNGTTDNDPPRTLPWRWDWYKFAPGETPNETRTFSGAWYSRRFGGDLQGVIEKLPYFRDLGVTALYFCPVFEADSNHGYDTIDYRHISQWFGYKGDNEEIIKHETLDPSTWKWTPSDKLFLEFIKKAHAQGLKVVVDGVFNHMGKSSFALQDVLTNGVKSMYADWFDVTDWGPPVKYRSWDGGGWMPNFRKDAEHGIASETARQYIFNITRRWMDPNGDGDPSDGVDGWRLDVAPDVPPAFWRDWRKHVKGINPNAYITGEDWGVATSHLQGDEWDAVMNYQFAMRAIRFFIDKQRKISPSELDRQLKQLLALYPMQVNFVMQNLYDSHDTDRLVNMVINPDRNFDYCNRPQDGCPYDGSKPGSDAYRVMKLMATFQMMFLGAPMIWYGDEAGMFGADDPTDRKPMLWKDLQPYDNPQDFVMDDEWNHYARLVAIRNTYPALRTGLYQAILTDDANGIFAFTRTLSTNMVTVVVNNSEKDQSVEVPAPYPNGTRVVDLLSAPVEFYDAPMSSLAFPQFDKKATVRALRVKPNAAVLNVRDGKIRLNLSPKSAALLVGR